MVIYEVNHLDIRPDIHDSYCLWLAVHAREMLSLAGFVGVDWFECESPTGGSTSHNVCLHYHLHGQDDLDRYLREDAPRMRAEGLRLFPGGSTIARRVLRPRRPPFAPEPQLDCD